MIKKSLLITIMGILVLFSFVACSDSSSTGPEESTKITFTITDGTESYTNIKIKGTFTDWNPVAMVQDGNVWTLEIEKDSIAVGDHEWGAIEDDGSEWGIWLIVGDNRTFTKDEEGIFEGDFTYDIPVPNDGLNITLRVDMNAETVDAAGVFVAGGFQNWDQTATQLTDDDADGIYEVTVQMEADVAQQFKFLNGSTWEEVPAAHGVDDGYGGFNREIIVTEDATFTYIFSGAPVE